MLSMDIRGMRAEHLMGFDLIALLAALSNDPLSSLRYQTTYDINRRGGSHA